MKKLLLVATALTGLTGPTDAATWPLSLMNLYPNAEFNPSQHTVEFYPGASMPAEQYKASGAFALLNMPAVTMTWNQMGVDVDYSSLGGLSFMRFTDGVRTGNFDLTPGSIQVLINTPNHVVLSGSGTITMTGFDPTPAHWAVDAVPIAAAYGWWPQVGFGVAPAPVPLPAALPLFVAGLGLLGWLGMRRSRNNHHR